MGPILRALEKKQTAAGLRAAVCTLEEERHRHATRSKPNREARGRSCQGASRGVSHILGAGAFIPLQANSRFAASARGHEHDTNIEVCV
jgi:hypothetical protein